MHVQLPSGARCINFRLRQHVISLVLIAFARKIVSQYDQEIPQSYTADQPTVPRGRATEH